MLAELTVLLPVDLVIILITAVASLILGALPWTDEQIQEVDDAANSVAASELDKLADLCLMLGIPKAELNLRRLAKNLLPVAVEPPEDTAD